MFDVCILLPPSPNLLVCFNLAIYQYMRIKVKLVKTITSLRQTNEEKNKANSSQIRILKTKIIVLVSNGSQKTKHTIFHIQKTPSVRLSKFNSSIRSPYIKTRNCFTNQKQYQPVLKTSPKLKKF